MKNTINILLLLLFFTAANAQTAKLEEGYYRSSNDFKSNNILPSGDLLSASSTDLVFKFLYTKVYYNSRNVWGYRNKEGKDYRSIEGKFYEVVLANKICVYQFVENNETSFRVSYGPAGMPLEMTSDNVLKLLSDNPAIASQYKSLGGKDRKEKAIDFIERYNSSTQISAIDSVNK